MNKERLEEFREELDFLADSADMEDYHRFVDTLQNLYIDGELNWIYRYAKEQAQRVQDQQATIDSLSMAHDAIHREIPKDKHTLIKNIIGLNKRVQELEKANKDNYWIASDYKFENLKLEQQNKLYREAFNKSREIWDKAYENYKGNKVEYLDGMLYGAKFIIDIFEKALEESE